MAGCWGLFQKPYLFTSSLPRSTQCSYCCSLYRITHFLYMAVSCGDSGHIAATCCLSELLQTCWGCMWGCMSASPCPALLICCFSSVFFCTSSLFLGRSCAVVQLVAIFRENKVCAQKTNVIQYPVCVSWPKGKSVSAPHDPTHPQSVKFRRGTFHRGDFPCCSKRSQKELFSTALYDPPVD